MTILKQAKEFDLRDNTIECDISYRGGTLKIDVSDIFPNVDEPIMGAYQNYLGGGIAGSIVGAAMFDPSELSKPEQKAFEVLKDRIKLYFYDLNNGGGDEYMQEKVNSFKMNQSLPISGY